MSLRLRSFFGASLLIWLSCGTPENSLTNPNVGDWDCADELVPAPTWFSGEATAALAGHLELGQTHVVGVDDTRIVPRMVAERETLALFTPTSPLPDGEDVRIAAFAGDTLLGVVSATPPSEPVPLLEQALTQTALEPYSDEAWWGVLPWDWVREGVEVRVGVAQGQDHTEYAHTLTGLGAPHVFTLTRTPMVLFGEPDFDTTTVPGARLARDHFAAIPASEVRFVDQAPWRLDEMVVRTPSGPQWVSSEAERLEVASDLDHWSIMKHQFVLRGSLANTGRGLALTGETEGDSSPYSVGTWVGIGWFRGVDGAYYDLDDPGVAAGWTGWTGLWNTWDSQCGNAWIHEVGHSFTLEHFVEGTAAGWGIAEEYPLDGVQLVTHPWGYDTVRRQLRTWYRVDASGPVTEASGLVGKRDPMNGGESSNSVTCFPPYTAYQARKTQRWLQDTPTLRMLDGQPEVVAWDPESAAYVAIEADPAFGTPVALDVPVATIVGTLGQNDEVCQSYPAMFGPSGHVFDLPAPDDADLPGRFDGAVFFVRTRYADGSLEDALIARAPVTDTALSLFSLNLDLARSPQTVELWRADAGYPDIDTSQATLLHTRELAAPPEAFAPVVTVGRGSLGASEISLTDRCTLGVSCASRSAEATWRATEGPLAFGLASEAPDEVSCSAAGSSTEFTVPVEDESGAAFDVVLHGQRVVSQGAASREVAMEDATPWFAGADLSQSLRVWLPYEANAGLPPGRYRTPAGQPVTGFVGGVGYGETVVTVDLEVLERTPIDLSSTYVSAPLSTPESSMYFVLRDPTMGPTERVWWEDDVDGPTSLFLPVFDASGTEALVHIHGQQESCGERWDMHAGRGASSTCSHAVVLSVAPEGHVGLQAGVTYQSDPSMPLVIEGRRWHDPGGTSLVGTFAFDVTVQGP